MCPTEDNFKGSYNCEGLTEMLKKKFINERKYFIDEIETIFTVSQMINQTNFQFMVAL